MTTHVFIVNGATFKLQGEDYQRIRAAFQEFNANNFRRCAALRYIEYQLEENKLVFTKAEY
jgi:hypothetical protein